MKHTNFIAEGNTADLERALCLSNLPIATRKATVTSLRDMTAVLGHNNDLSVDRLRAALEDVGPDLRHALGTRSSQILSDARRALRIWNDEPTRWLALTLRDKIPTLRDAQLAAGLVMNQEDARRATVAIDSLARCHSAVPEDMHATVAQIGRMLANATPEDFGVDSQKSVENKRSLILRAVKLVDPFQREVRKAEVDALPRPWARALRAVQAELADHEKSVAAVAKRFALTGAKLGLAPKALPEGFCLAFFENDRATRSATHIEKLRRFIRVWNAVATNGQGLTPLPSVFTMSHRQESLRWSDVPEAIRGPLDAILDRAVSARSLSDWSALVVDDPNDEYLEFGVGPARQDIEDGSIVLEEGSRKNWRDAVKRAWHAAQTSERIVEKPRALSDLFALPVAQAMVVGARRARRIRVEAQGKTYNPKEKGRYEHGLVETLCSVARATGLSADELQDLEEFKRDIDPAVIGMKLNSEGKKVRIFAERRIGKRHAERLQAFSKEACLRRYFEAPATLWHLSRLGVGHKKTPAKKHIAQARNAIFIRIAQYVGPLRRSSLVGLRWTGDDPHLLLPTSEGEGTLRIPAIETKTIETIHVQIDRETVWMIKAYIRDFLPTARANAGSSDQNPHLFPGHGGKRFAQDMRHITKEKANGTFKKQLRKHCGLEVNLHVMRHIAGKITLDQDPSAMDLVRRLLGHKSIETTQSYYAEVSSLIAQRQYLHLLERSQRAVLAKVHFEIKGE